MDIRDIIFPNFPRKVGNPKQIMIHSRKELNRFAAINSATNDKNFASICSYINDDPVFEDIFLETDILDPAPVRKIVSWYKSKNIPCAVLLSARKGFHIHALFKPDPSITQTTVKKFSNMVLSETDTTEFFDSHVTGDIKRLCRIPNTQRLNNGWCVPITHKELFTINDISKFKQLCKSPRFLNFKEPRRPSIKSYIKNYEDNKQQKEISTAPPKSVFFLKDMLRPCVYENICAPNPKHNYRVSATVELLNHGLTSTQILLSFEKLSWIDFDHVTTMYQIQYIESKRVSGEFMIPYGKKKLNCDKNVSCIECILKS